MKKVYGVGINDLKGGTKHPSYTSWRRLLKLCYKVSVTSVTSDSVCEEWFYLSNFHKWYVIARLEGSKFTKLDGCMEYNPDTCYFEPKKPSRVKWDKSLLTSNGNANRPPKGLAHCIRDGHIKVLNYGAGAYHELHSSLYPNVFIQGYDPNVPDISDKPVYTEKFDAVVCCNVLNVLENMSDVEEVLSDLDKYESKIIYLYVWRGEGTCNSRYMKTGTYQRNMPPNKYNFLTQFGYTYSPNNGGHWIKYKGGKDETSF
ncbi:MAG: hypothetical protein ACRCZ0_08235 [Cetobacterium sp.]